MFAATYNAVWAAKRLQRSIVELRRTCELWTWWVRQGSEFRASSYCGRTPWAVSTMVGCATVPVRAPTSSRSSVLRQQPLQQHLAQV